MNVLDIQDSFREKGLNLPDLNILAADAHLYEVLAIQPRGEVRAEDHFIGDSNRELSQKKFISFLDLAAVKGADLALAPEYSCPWSALTNAFERSRLPALRKLWILGCESITREDLNGIISAFPGIIWIHEPFPTSACHFFDPLCYLMKTTSNSGDVKDVALLQFKTQAMADVNAFERDRLIEGNTIYFLHDDQDNIRLISLICSETLTFDDFDLEHQCRLGRHPFLIFHPQLNLLPLDPPIKAYRGRLFADNDDKTEVLTLNWARGSRIPGRPSSKYGGSAVYMKSRHFLRSDRRIEENHRKGLYYMDWHPYRSHLSVMNFDEYTFHFRMPKIHLVGAGVLSNRTGPQMLSVWKWKSDEERWCESNQVDDGFPSACNSFGEGSFDCCLGTTFSSVDRERLLALSTGKLKPKADWYAIENLDSFFVGENEVSKRLIFAQENEQGSGDFRKDHLSLYIKLHNQIIADYSIFPDTISDLKNNCTLLPPNQTDGFRFNLFGATGTAPGATAVFVGHRPPPEVKQLRDEFVSEWGQQNTRRLVIWYEHLGAIKCEHSALATITDDSENPTSITRAGRQ